MSQATDNGSCLIELSFIFYWVIYSSRNTVCLLFPSYLPQCLTDCYACNRCFELRHSWNSGNSCLERFQCLNPLALKSHHIHINWLLNLSNPFCIWKLKPLWLLLHTHIHSCTCTCFLWDHCVRSIEIRLHMEELCKLEDVIQISMFCSILMVR